jgi:hypothetical protein
VTFLAPVFLAAGALVAASIVLLHFLARRRPRAAVFPTARFVPDRPARWPSRAPRPTDLLLLAVRVLAVLAIAAAFAGPVRTPDRATIARIVLVDCSRAVADEGAMRDSAIALLREGDVLIPFDTSLRIVATGARDTAAMLARSSAPASFSAALIAAERAAATMRDRADSIELVIVSPFAAEAWDEATAGLRARWSGRTRLIAIPLAAGDSSSLSIEVRAPPSDAVSAAAAPFLVSDQARARIVREAPGAADSSWARSRGHVLVHWPRQVTDSLSAEAVAASSEVLVAPLVRRTANADAARVVARFADGAPAIVERLLDDGCIRDVAFDLPRTGDVPLRESVRRLVGVIAAPCETHEYRSAMTATRMDSLRGTGPLLSTAALARTSRERSAATSWLLIAGALILMIEVGLRQRTGTA